MASLRTLSGSLGIVAGLGVLMAAGPAHADWHGHHGWHEGWHHGWRGWGPPAVVVAPRPYYYAPPPVVYAPPPPVYYAPPPAYYSPGISFGVNIR